MMTAALIGLLGTVFAAVLLLAGTLHTTRAPAHWADAQAWQALVNELQEDRDAWRARALSAEAKLRGCGNA